jgi:hypothetical protein
MPRKRSAKAWVKKVQDGECDCDSALEAHLAENYRGPLDVPAGDKVHLALCCFNRVSLRDRVLELRDGPVTVSQLIKELGLEPFCPLFDQQQEARFKMGDVVRFGNEHWGYVCRVLGRREVTPFAMLRTDDWEIFLEALDGQIVGFVGECEVEPMEETNHER